MADKEVFSKKYFLCNYYFLYNKARDRQYDFFDVQKSVDDLFYCLVHQMEEILSNEILMLTLLVTKFLVGYVVNFNPIFLDTH